MRRSCTPCAALDTWSVTALVRLFRTTAFKLSLLYLAIFAVGTGLVLARLGSGVQELLDRQIKLTIQAEIDDLAEQFGSGGLGGAWRLESAITSRTLQPTSALYLFTNYAGVPLIGNVAALPEGTLDRDGIVETTYRQVGSRAPHLALARTVTLEGGFHLLVGRDIELRERLLAAVGQALITALICIAVVGLLGGLYVASRVLHRINGMTATAKTIMAGNLAGRLPIAGTGDELDRLAENLNAMLERIAELMAGLKQVSDNIAHDLKTPLTRLHNDAEQALRGAREPAQYRAALERIIEESDGLIRIFNALLMIARAEAGSGREGMTDFDAGAVTRDVAELYEPLAEEAGASLSVSIEPALPVHGNRELVSQALVNLVDNALKYGVTAEGRAPALAMADAVAPGASPEPPDGPLPAEQGDWRARGEITLSARRVGRSIEIAVADRGPGIRESDRARARERFVRLEDSRSQPGSGLGLSLASAVAHLHGGELRMEDNDPGLRVVIAIPARDTVALPGKQPPGAP
ncbi:MAG: HAMP domain-containing protein [Methylobacteriaceae bacterium]|nr:HAMP domain-containing protein [Methylobacteriaceae bacterium]MBV9634946.1 HAMP domain-containing protein [Methylobacteriaceae bacterium]